MKKENILCLHQYHIGTIFFLRVGGIYCMSKLLIDSETGELLNEYWMVQFSDKIYRFNDIIINR